MANSNSSIIGSSKIIQTTLATAKRVARTNLSVLVTGETGTGKELFARLVHAESTRAKGPFVTLNCASIPGELLESELFGHKKGAFTGAVSDQEGLFVQANGGTLFLDEIGDMPFPLQAKILRVLQEREVRPVGGNVLRKVDVRVVAATHRNLEEMVSQGRFREDLLSRLRGYMLELPPLRDRGRDVITLARLFLHASKEGSGKCLGHDAQALLLAYRWPGNIRELQHAIQAAAVDAPGSIGAQHLRRHLRCVENAPVEVGASIGQKILVAIGARGQATLAQLHTDLKVPKPTLHRYLGRLQEDGQVRRFCKNEAVWFAVGGEDALFPDALLPDRQSKAMAFIGQKGRITRQQYADVFGVSIRTASRDLSDMLSNGRLRLDGQPGKLAGYQVCV